MTQSNHEGYTYLQVYRPVTDRPKDFLHIVELLSRRIFGDQPITSFEEIGMDNEILDDDWKDVEASKSITTVSGPVIDVYRASDLKLLLLRRTVSNAAGGRYNLNSQAARFTARPQQQRNRDGKLHTVGPKNKIREGFDEISLNAGLDPHRLLVKFDQLHEIHDRGFGPELALAPKIGHVASTVVRDQSRYCADILDKISPRTANPSGPMTAVVPFMAVPEGASSKLLERFCDIVYDRKLLPVYFTVGQMYADAPELVGSDA